MEGGVRPTLAGAQAQAPTRGKIPFSERTPADRTS